MCWSADVSAIFACIYLFFILFYLWWKPRQYKIYVMFGVLYMSMELLQMLQWLYGDVGTCTSRNRFATYAAWVLVWIQPFYFALVGYMAYQNTTFKRLAIFNFIVFILNFLALVWVSEHNISFGHIQQDAAISSTTCTFEGPNHHLAWRWAGIHIDFVANYQLYAVLCIGSFIFYDWDLMTIPFSWSLTLLITVRFFKISYGELGSYWCFLSVICNFTNLIWCIWFDKAFAEKKKNI
jgi:hypothetical protein